MNHRIFERKLRSRGYPPGARSLECRSFTITPQAMSWCARAASAKPSTKETGFTTLLAAAAASVYCVRARERAH